MARSAGKKRATTYEHLHYKFTDEQNRTPGLHAHGHMRLRYIYSGLELERLGDEQAFFILTYIYTGLETERLGKQEHNLVEKNICTAHLLLSYRDAWVQVQTGLGLCLSTTSTSGSV
jgi:hypothetical protein